MSQVYDPNMDLFQNPAMRDIAIECDQKMRENIQEIILKAQHLEEESAVAQEEMPEETLEERDKLAS